MNPLIKDGDIILDGTKTRKQAEKEAFEKLGYIEMICHIWEIKDLEELKAALSVYFFAKKRILEDKENGEQV